MMKFVEFEPAMLLGDYLVVSDIHLGYEAEYENKGYSIPDQTSNIIRHLENLSKFAKKLVILGDLKHEIISRDALITVFFSKISSVFDKIILVKGNHDGKIEDYTKSFSNISVVDELMLDSNLLIHGHKNPSVDNMKKAKTILLGHFHSSKVFKTEFSIQQFKSWTIYDFNNENYYLTKKLKTSIKRVISFPCFNPLFLGRGEKIGPLKNYLSEKHVLLLDYTKVF